MIHGYLRRENTILQVVRICVYRDEESADLLLTYM